jgi:hypothetical protein
MLDITETFQACRRSTASVSAVRAARAATPKGRARGGGQAKAVSTWRLLACAGRRPGDGRVRSRSEACWRHRGAQRRIAARRVHANLEEKRLSCGDRPRQRLHRRMSRQLERAVNAGRGSPPWPRITESAALAVEGRQAPALPPIRPGRRRLSAPCSMRLLMRTNSGSVAATISVPRSTTYFQAMRRAGFSRGGLLRAAIRPRRRNARRH